MSEARALGLESDDGDDTVDALAGELPLASGVAVLHCDVDPDTLGEGVGLELSCGEPDDDTHPDDDVVAKTLGELLSLRRADREGGTVPLTVTLVVAVIPSDPERDADAHLEPVDDAEADGAALPEWLSLTVTDGDPDAEAHTEDVPEEEAEGGLVELTTAVLLADCDAVADPHTDAVMEEEGDREPVIEPVDVLLLDGDKVGVELPLDWDVALGDAVSERDASAERLVEGDMLGEALGHGDAVSERDAAAVRVSEGETLVHAVPEMLVIDDGVASDEREPDGHVLAVAVVEPDRETTLEELEVALNVPVLETLSLPVGDETTDAVE